jgi:hypothetical protein
LKAIQDEGIRVARSALASCKTADDRWVAFKDAVERLLLLHRDMLRAAATFDALRAEVCPSFELTSAEWAEAGRLEAPEAVRYVHERVDARKAA